MENYNKAYNTHLVVLWLENNYNNYKKAGEWYHHGTTQEETLDFIKGLEYGGDREKISFDLNDLYIKSIMENIREISEEIYK